MESQQNTHHDLQQYRTPCYQLARQIFMLIIACCTAILSMIISILTNKLNENMHNVQSELANRTFVKIVN